MYPAGDTDWYDFGQRNLDTLNVGVGVGPAHLDVYRDGELWRSVDLAVLSGFSFNDWTLPGEIHRWQVAVTASAPTDWWVHYNFGPQ